MESVAIIILGLSLFSIPYTLWGGYTVWCLSRWAKRTPLPGPDETIWPKVSIFKPLCGNEPQLYENLVSFCQQDYPDFDILCAVHTQDDPATTAVRSLQKAFPDRSISLILSPLDGTEINAKAWSLTAMARKTKAEIIVISDSDIQVEPDSLRRIAAEFFNPQIGATTCLYRGRSHDKLATIFGAMYINDWLLSSIALAVSYGPLRYCMGATMAIRRKTLDAFGGFEELKHYLADDYMMGKLTYLHGWQVSLAPCFVTTWCHDDTWRDLIRHELRWGRTIRNLRPISHALVFLGDAILWSVLYLSLSGFSSMGWLVLTLAWLARLGQQTIIGSTLPQSNPYRQHRLLSFALIPARDLLRSAVWLASCFIHRIHWRQTILEAPQEGQINRVN